MKKPFSIENRALTLAFSLRTNLNAKEFTVYLNRDRFLSYSIRRHLPVVLISQSFFDGTYMSSRSVDRDQTLYSARHQITLEPNTSYAISCNDTNFHADSFLNDRMKPDKEVLQDFNYILPKCPDIDLPTFPNVIDEITVEFQFQEEGKRSRLNFKLSELWIGTISRNNFIKKGKLFQYFHFVSETIEIFACW
jgi:hypothetical protein